MVPKMVWLLPEMTIQSIFLLCRAYKRDWPAPDATGVLAADQQPLELNIVHDDWFQHNMSQHSHALKKGVEKQQTSRTNRSSPHHTPLGNWVWYGLVG